MAYVRCPMCGKANTPEAEVCAFCGARLKPLRLNPNEQPEAGSSKSGGSQRNDEPDWLSQLRSDSPAPSQEDSSDEPLDKPSEKPVETFPADSDVPDWLARIRDRARTETGGPSGMPGEGKDEEEALDWLSGLSEETPAGAEGTGGEPPALDIDPAFSPASDDDDWISKLSSWQAGLAEEDAAGAASNAAESGGAAFPGSQASEVSGAEDEFGWLHTPGSQGETSGSFATPGSGASPDSGPFTVSPEEGGIEWAKPEEKSSSERPSSGFGITGFLSSLDEKDAQQRQAAQPPAGDWNEEVFTSGEQPPSTAPDEALPDWLSGAQAPTEAPAPVPGASGTELPDWLQGLQGLDKDLPAQPAASEPSGGTEVPDWLRADSGNFVPTEPGTLEETPAASSAQPFTQLPEQPAGEEAALPDWLSAVGGQSPASESFAEEPPEPRGKTELESAWEAEAASQDLPDWLGGAFASREETPAAPSSTEAAPAPEAASAAEEDLPDWFAGFEKEAAGEAQPNWSAGDVEPDAELPTQEAPLEPAASEVAPVAGQEAGDLAGEVPDWLRAFHDEARPGEEVEEGVPSLAGDQNMFTPSRDDATSLDISSLEEGEQPFTVDLPEWLGQDEAAQPAEEHEQPAEPAGEELAQAELPEWVKEMRPIESILPGEGAAADVDQRVEKAGPLAGMRGVLPVEDMAAHYRKLPGYTIKLHVTEKQRSQAALFDSILTQESQPLLIQPERSTGTSLLVRILVALVLLLVVAFPVVFDVGTLAAPMPALFPAENRMFQTLDQGVQSSAPVLLAIEYQPALSGEMRLAAGGVVQQLMAKNARIVLVSTVPAGPALGQQLLDDAAASYKTRTGNVYSTAEMTANLGYLPGGTISLLDFAQQPQRAAPVTLNGRPAWGENSFLKGVTNISGFSQVIVLTDRAEVGRAWVEQVQPQLGKAPLLVVASAQAAPLLQPYLASGQIAGMTGGLLGGAIYAQLAGQAEGPMFSYLPAYQVGVLLAFLIVLVGGVFSAVMALVRRNAREEE